MIPQKSRLWHTFKQRTASILYGWGTCMYSSMHVCYIQGLLRTTALHVAMLQTNDHSQADAPPAAEPPCPLRAAMTSNTTGSTDTATIPSTTSVKLCWTTASNKQAQACRTARVRENIGVCPTMWPCHDLHSLKSLQGARSGSVRGRAHIQAVHATF